MLSVKKRALQARLDDLDDRYSSIAIIAKVLIMKWVDFVVSALMAHPATSSDRLSPAALAWAAATSMAEWFSRLAWMVSEKLIEVRSR